MKISVDNQLAVVVSNDDIKNIIAGMVSREEDREKFFVFVQAKNEELVKDMKNHILSEYRDLLRTTFKNVLWAEDLSKLSADSRTTLFEDWANFEHTLEMENGQIKLSSSSWLEDRTAEEDTFLLVCTYASTIFEWIDEQEFPLWKMFSTRYNMYHNRVENILGDALRGYAEKFGESVYRLVEGFVQQNIFSLFSSENNENAKTCMLDAERLRESIWDFSQIDKEIQILVKNNGITNFWNVMSWLPKVRGSHDMIASLQNAYALEGALREIVEKYATEEQLSDWTPYYD